MRVTLVLALMCLASAMGGSAVQTDWSGGPDVFGPSSVFGNTFSSPTNIDWISAPGSIHAGLQGYGTISVDIDGPCAVCPGDIDGDGDTDIVTASWYTGTYLWCENEDGWGSSWTVHFLGGVLQKPYPASLGDVDGDGDLDFVGASWQNGQVVLWVNTDGLGTDWDEYLVSDTLWHPTCTDLFDLDEDGDLDLLCTDEGLGIALWMENTDGQGKTWASHLVDPECDGARNICPLDADGDGDQDLAAASYGLNKMFLYLNEDGSGTDWERITVTSNPGGAYGVTASDIDGDGDMDLAGVGLIVDVVRWWENEDGGAIWSVHTVSSIVDGARSVRSADFNGDDEMDLLATACYGDRVILYTNLGGGTGWKPTILSATYEGACDARASDINGDGRPDVVAAGSDGDLLGWWSLDGYSPYAQLTSTVLDTGAGPIWGSIDWAAVEPVGTSIGFKVRASSNYTDMGTWSEEFTAPGWISPYLEDGDRYVQYMACLHGNIVDTPLLEEVTVSWSETGISSPPLEDPFLQVVPNPATTSASILFLLPSPVNTSIRVVDLAGRTVFSTSVVSAAGEGHEIGLPGMTPGVYFVVLEAGADELTDRFVIVR